jgi:hypothetical protein
MKLLRYLIFTLRIALPAMAFLLWARSYFICDEYFDIREHLLRASDEAELPLADGNAKLVDWQFAGPKVIRRTRTKCLISGQGLLSAEIATDEWPLTSRDAYENLLRFARSGNIAKHPGHSSFPSPDREYPAPAKFGIPVLTDIRFARFAIQHAQGTLRGTFTDTYVIDIPYWLLTLLSSLPLLARYAFIRYHRPGRCPNCNYDLRASKDRCPECGHPIPNPNRGAPVPPAADCGAAVPPAD